MHMVHLFLTTKLSGKSFPQSLQWLGEKIELFNYAS